MSISPWGVTTLRARMRMPERRRKRAAARSDLVPNQRRHHGLRAGEGGDMGPPSSRRLLFAFLLPSLLLRPSRAAGHQKLAALALPLAKPGRLADAVAEVIKLGPADLAGPLHLDLGDLRRVDGEDALDALALHDTPDREHLAKALALPRDDHAVEHLDALLAAFQDALVDVHRVADRELRKVLLRVGLFHQAHQSVLHGPSPSFF